MKDILLKFAQIVDKIGSLLDLKSTAGAIALTIGFIIAAILLCSFVLKFVKKKCGKAIAVILVIIIIACCILLTLGQIRNFIEASGMVITEGWAQASEGDGSWFISWLESLMDNDSSDVGGFDFSGGSWQ